MNQDSTEVQAAKKLIEEADKLYRNKQSRDAMSRLIQAQLLVEKMKPELKPLEGTRITAGPHAVGLKVTEGEMEALKEDVFALFKRAGDMYKEDDTRYKAAQNLFQQAATEYTKYKNINEATWDTLYNSTYTKLIHEARKNPPVTAQAQQNAIAGAQEAVTAEKTKKLRVVVNKLTQARTWLRMALN